MIKVANLHVPLTFERETLVKACADKLKIPADSIQNVQLVKKSVDAREKDNVHFAVAVEAEIEGNEKKLVAKRRSGEITIAEPYRYPAVPCRQKLSQRPIVIGFGPAGMFAALTLAQAGQNPIVFERGQSVEQRQEAVQQFWKKRQLHTESNVQFGEGGAGTFSDGKLNTGTKDSRIRKVLEEFVKAGAPVEILYEAKPHLGTDRLPGIVRSIREEIIRLGGEVHFESKLINFSQQDGRLTGITIQQNAGEREIPCSHLVLAVGHSARDTFEMLLQNKLAMQAKAFSVGVRIEHPAQWIDQAQYGDFAGSPYLGAADYKLAHRLADGRGIYTFCMCPGGYVTGSASEEGMVVTNGMSEFARDGKNSNAALLVGVSPEDFGTAPLDGIAFQRKIERDAFVLAGSDYSAPAQTVGSFLKGAVDSSLSGGAVLPTYEPGTVSADLNRCLPDFVTTALHEGIRQFGKKLKRFDHEQAILTAPETRSSSPVRLLRTAENCQAINLQGLYPCGEGAGYAGGITSAAVDGIRCAEKILEKG